MNPSVAAISLLLRRIPFESGRWRLIPYGLKLCKDSYTATSPKRVRTRCGFQMIVDANEWVGRHIYVTGEYEPSTSALLQACLRRGDVFVDVGANVGFFSLLAAKCVGRQGRVFAFEPVPSIRDCLRTNISINKFSQCEVFGVAASNADGIRELFVGPKDHTSISSFRELDRACEKLQVPMARLDAILTEQHRVDVVKIDVEGAECHVLEGMQGVLQQSSPDLIVEITPEYLAALGRSTRELQEAIAPHGYKSFAIEHEGLRPLNRLEDHKESQFNAFFTVKSSLPSGIRILT